MRERLSRVDTLARVKHEHLLEQVERLRVGPSELLCERHRLAFRQRLDKAQSLRVPDAIMSASQSCGTRGMSCGIGARGLTFSEQMVWMTSSGGVPRSSVMIENWLT